MAEQVKTKHPGGRPLKFKSVEELRQKINEYFAQCDESKRPYTITGLALALDTDRQTLVNYEKREEFFDTIKAAKARVENYLEENLYGSSVTGLIFNLKNNFGWRDKTETELTGKDGSPLFERVEIAPKMTRDNADEA